MGAMGEASEGNAWKENEWRDLSITKSELLNDASHKAQLRDEIEVGMVYWVS